MHRQREQREREKEHGRRAEQKNGGHPGVFLAALLLLAVLGVSRSGEAELDMLDVGQGDACYLQTKEGYHLFVDGGSSNVGKVGTYRILPFLKYKGVKRLTAGWCLIPMKTTSADCGRYCRRDIPWSIWQWRNRCRGMENWEELEALAEDVGTKVVWLGRGDIWHFGNATFTALHPGESEDAFGGQSVDKNEESLVLFYQEDDFAGVFTGDIGATQEEEILTWLQKTKTELTCRKSIFIRRRITDRAIPIPPGFWRRWHRRSHWCRAAEQTGTDTPSRRLSGICSRRGSQVYYTMESGRLCVKRRTDKPSVRGIWRKKNSGGSEGSLRHW